MLFSETAIETEIRHFNLLKHPCLLFLLYLLTFETPVEPWRILIFININTGLLPSHIFLFYDDPAELYSEKEPYIKLISNNLCYFMTNFFPKFGQKKRLHIIMITSVY